MMTKNQQRRSDERIVKHLTSCRAFVTAYVESGATHIRFSGGLLKRIQFAWALKALAGKFKDGMHGVDVEQLDDGVQLTDQNVVIVAKTSQHGPRMEVSVVRDDDSVVRWNFTATAVAEILEALRQIDEELGSARTA